MFEASSPHDLRKISLATGVSYLITHVTSVAAAMLIVSNATTAAIRTGILLELTLAITILVSGLGVQFLFRSHAPMLAGTFAGLRALEAAVIAVGTLPLLAMEEALPAQAAFAIHTAAFMVGQSLIISVNTLVLAALLLRTNAVPRWIAFLGAIGGTLVLLSNLAQFWDVLTNRAVAGLLALPVFAFEISFAVYLICAAKKN